ncbi:ATP-binding protein [Paeniglutamicibacter cryotolerans]|uniref:ATP-binding protein n=1 Tax=Paeniglutamicibacter cryotolerans TaxID=670079 RepID=UPI0038995E48
MGCWWPALKALKGFDYFSVHFPEDHGREALESLEFIERAQGLVLYGDVGPGKTHLSTTATTDGTHSAWFGSCFWPGWGVWFSG